jgi:hypothetical protein
LYNSTHNETKCVLICWLEISTPSLSLFLIQFWSDWLYLNWESVRTHNSWTPVWKCVEMCRKRERESQSNVENWYNLIEIERIVIDVCWVELTKWYWECFIVFVCFNWSLHKRGFGTFLEEISLISLLLILFNKGNLISLKKKKFHSFQSQRFLWIKNENKSEK